MCYRQSRRGVARQNSEKCKTIVCIANTFTHRRFYTQKLLHTEAFTQRLLHTKLLPTEAFTYRCFYTQMFLHTDAFTRTLLHTDMFTHRHFYTQTFLHTGAANPNMSARPEHDRGDRKISMPDHKQVKHTCTRTCLRERRSGNACGHVCSNSSGSKQKNVRANLSREILQSCLLGHFR